MMLNISICLTIQDHNMTDPLGLLRTVQDPTGPYRPIQENTGPYQTTEDHTKVCEPGRLSVFK